MLDFFNHPVFGYGATVTELHTILKACGGFYLIVGIGYALSILIFYRQYPTIKKYLGSHLFGVFIYFVFGLDLYMSSDPLSAFFLFLLATLGFFAITKVSISTYEKEITLPNSPAWKKLIARMHKKKSKINEEELAHRIYDNRNVNEIILWFIIWYVSLVAVRATVLLYFYHHF